MAQRRKRRKRKLSKKETKARAKIKTREALGVDQKEVTPEEKPTKKITLSEVVPVRILGEKLGIPPAKVLEVLLKNGVVANINESIDFETAALVALEFRTEVVKEKESIWEEKEEKEVKYEERSPVVIVMGHVDHGKTKLLDTIRKTNVVAGETGGITQHIGAYQVEVETKEKKRKQKKLITFLDTPGHEAFSKMRARGAEVTDVVVLVVAANDGVKPQTIEAISHARAAGVPIIVAINKIDLPEADVEKTKRELTQQNLVPEEWGGKTPMVEISAKGGIGIQELLEMIILISELQNLKAKSGSRASGVVIESKMKPGKGASATVLVKEGIIHQGDLTVVGKAIGRIRIMEDFRGKALKSASPSVPVEISGLKGLPQVGDRLWVVKDEKEARAIELKLGRVKTLKGITQELPTLRAKESEETRALKLIIKADVQGSLEAIKSQIEEIRSEKTKPNIISSGIGGVSESDVNLAQTTEAVILAFRVPVSPQVLKLAQTNQVEILSYQIIYKLVEEVVSLLQGLVRPEIIETEIGEVKLLKVFFRTARGGIAGGEVRKGKIRPQIKAKVLRDEVLLGIIEIESLKVGEVTIDEVGQGKQVGIGYKGEIKLKPDDTLKVIQTEERIEKIKPPTPTS